MQAEDRQTNAELPAKGDPDDVDKEAESETARPPIDEDVVGSVNAAVPDEEE
jgi:hypothetical protein